MQESPLFVKVYALLRWLIPLTLKFPRSQRFVLAAQMQQAAFKLQNRLLEAVHQPTAKEQARCLVAADVEVSKLRVYLRLAHDLGYISLDQQRHGGQLVAEIGRLLGGWQKKVRSASQGPD